MSVPLVSTQSPQHIYTSSFLWIRLFPEILKSLGLQNHYWAIYSSKSYILFCDVGLWLNWWNWRWLARRYDVAWGWPSWGDRPHAMECAMMSVLEHGASGMWRRNEAWRFLWSPGTAAAPRKARYSSDTTMDRDTRCSRIVWHTPVTHGRQLGSKCNQKHNIQVIL